MVLAVADEKAWARVPSVFRTCTWDLDRPGFVTDRSFQLFSFGWVAWPPGFSCPIHGWGLGL